MPRWQKPAAIALALFAAAYVATAASGQEIGEYKFTIAQTADHNVTGEGHYMLADGRTISAAAEPDLFAVLGHTFGGAGDDFNLPDMRGRAPVASSDSLTAGTVAGAPLTVLEPGLVIGAAFMLVDDDQRDPLFANVVVLPDLSISPPTDLSDSNHAMTLVPLATVTNGQLNLDADGLLRLPNDSPDWDFGTGDFAIEGYIEVDAFGASNESAIVATTSRGGPTGFDVRISSVTGISLWSANIPRVQMNAPFMSTSDPFAHFAVTREDGLMRIFRDGVLQASSTFVGEIGTGAASGLWIGDYVDVITTAHAFDGRIKGFRITKGTARYTTDFTPPTLPLPTS